LHRVARAETRLKGRLNVQLLIRRSVVRAYWLVAGYNNYWFDRA
jgi:hypothetical protein